MCEHQPRAPTAEPGLAPSVEQALGQGADGGAHGEKHLQASRRGMMGKGVQAWSTHRKEAGLGGCDIPTSMIMVVTNVPASVASSGAP